MSFQNHMIFFPLVNTKGDILNNVLAVCPYYKRDPNLSSHSKKKKKKDKESMKLIKFTTQLVYLKSSELKQSLCEINK